MIELNWRTYPIAVLGFDIRRWEEVKTGVALYFEGYTKKFVLWEKHDNLGPTHIQYDSPFGFLITWPLCFHAWYQFRPQAVSNGLRVEGSEIVLLFSVGVARWDAWANCYMIPRFYIGGRWD